MSIQRLAEYPYLYETHLHTSQGSACARCTGAQMAEACKAAGYTGIIVTDHNWGGNTAVNRRLPWKTWVNEFAKGYEEAEKVGKRIGLDVFFGYEAGFDATEFLIYGLDKKFMLEHPELRTATVQEQFRLVHEGGGMVVHAHPFREEYYIPEVRLFPEYVDGAEGINGGHIGCRHETGESGLPVFDERAIAYARGHNLFLTAGSDIHHTDLPGCGMAFRRRMESIQDFTDALRNGEDYVLTDGKRWFRKDGTPCSS